MGYKNANEILPTELLDEVQKYIDGKYIYIPRKYCNKKSWGENTETKRYIDHRNFCIYNEYKNGISIKKLSEKYYLVEKSIQRIIRQEKNKK
ncbi:hypothetical protein NRP93_003345 [Clostridium botulinum]|nr:hypothetical protein [Clostridium botulinum]